MSFVLDPDGASAALGDGRSVRVLKGLGLRLFASSFHLDEGPQLAWVNPYRILARGGLLGYGRTTPVSNFDVVDGDALATWEAFGLRVRTRVVSESVIDTEFAVALPESADDYEIFVSSYFTPNQDAYFRVKTSPYWNEDAEWLHKTGVRYEPTMWLRDNDAGRVVFDGRWSHGHPPQFWVIGSFYSVPLMVQVHHYADLAIATMARREDCFAISGLSGYHNSQYFHLFGRTLQDARATVRLVILPKAGALDAALEAYDEFSSATVSGPRQRAQAKRRG